jgi:hypothetical protein
MSLPDHLLVWPEPTETDRAICSALRAGHSIASVMTPDPLIPSNQPEHRESFVFKHAVVHQDHAWVMTPIAHRVLRSRVAEAGIEGQARSTSFVYGIGAGDLFCSHCEEDDNQSSTALMHRSRYRDFSFISSSRGECVWSNEDPGNFRRLLAAMEAGSEMVSLLLDEEDILNIDSVNLVQVSQHGTPALTLRSEHTTYPLFLREPLSRLRQLFGDIRVGMAQELSVANVLGTQFHSYVCAFEDGSYYNFYDEIRTMIRRYKRLEIFANPPAGETTRHEMSLQGSLSWRQANGCA